MRKLFAPLLAGGLALGLPTSDAVCTRKETDNIATPAGGRFRTDCRRQGGESPFLGFGVADGAVCSLVPRRTAV